MLALPQDLTVILRLLNPSVVIAGQESELNVDVLPIRAHHAQRPDLFRSNPDATVAASDWFGPQVEMALLSLAGVKPAGGGPHQSKTMMLAEVSAVVRGGFGDNAKHAVVEDNLLSKPSQKAREVALRRLSQLYGIGQPIPICLALRGLWGRFPEAGANLALICALARDPAFRDGAGPVLDAELGEQVQWPAIAGAFETKNPGRLTQESLKSLAQHAASSWTQAGFLRGKQRKERVRAAAAPVIAAYAALIGSLCGFGGISLLRSRWMDLVDRAPEERLGLLRQAEGIGLARVRSAGDVLEIEVRRPMAATLGVPALGHG